MNIVQRLIEVFGTESDTARAFDVDRQVVQMWKRQGYIPWHWDERVEEKTAGAITAAEVRETARARKKTRSGAVSPELL